MMQTYSFYVLKLLETDQSSFQLFFACLQAGIKSKNTHLADFAAKNINFYYSKIKYLAPIDSN